MDWDSKIDLKIQKDRFKANIIEEFKEDNYESGI